MKYWMFYYAQARRLSPEAKLADKSMRHFGNLQASASSMRSISERRISMGRPSIDVPERLQSGDVKLSDATRRWVCHDRR